MDQNSLYIVKTLVENGHIAYYAGGCVRDMLMGNLSSDVDIATSATPEQVMKLFKKTIPVGIRFGVVIVLLDQKNYEVTTFRKEQGYEDGRHPTEVDFTSDAKQDAQRRDFTINGMFYDPLKEKIIDYVNGQKDIQDKIIRAINDPFERFEEDKLRILRAVRFAARFNFKIEERTREAILQKAKEINCVSAERIRDELIKMFVHKNRSLGLQMLYDYRLLHEILPEVAAMHGVEQPPEFHPEGDVFIHTKLVLDYIGDNPSAVLAFAALLHDVGKPPCYEKTDEIHFPKHSYVGAQMADEILKRLKFSNQERDKIVLYIDEHMRFADMPKMREGKLKKMLQRESILEELALHVADCQASHGNMEVRDFCLKKLNEYSLEELKPKPLINGEDLIALGYQPSALFKKILEDVELQQLEGRFKTKEQAIGYVKENYFENKN